ncbi:hypothetical protein ACFE04_025248 [Oxalis oulophora]
MDMRKVVLVLLSIILVFVLAESFDYEEKDLQSEESLWDLYERWRSHHTDSHSLQDKGTRFNVFKENLRHIHKVNQMNMPYKLKLNKFSDMTNHEFVQSYTSKVKHFRMLHGSRRTTGFMHEKTVQLPSSIDWRKHGAVNDVKDQGHCEANYPYKAKDEKCDSKRLNTPAVIIDDYEMVPQNDEKSLKKAVANQPVIVGIDASGDFQHYSEGVFNGTCGTELNHGVAIVGYGKTQKGLKYWTVRNSWGDDWGEKGYVRIARDVEAPEGLCGITLEASYPVKLYPDNKNRHNKDEL